LDVRINLADPHTLNAKTGDIPNFNKKNELKPSIQQLGNYYFNKYYKSRCYRKIESLKNFLGPKEYLVGYLTIADFKLANVIDLFGKMCSRFCLVNPFGDFHSLEYKHLGLKSHPDDKEHEEVLRYI
jgi:glutathione S-transferase